MTSLSDPIRLAVVASLIILLRFGVPDLLPAQNISAGTSFALCFMDNEGLDRPGATFRLYISGSRNASGTIRYGNEAQNFIVVPGIVTTADIPLSFVLAYPGAVEQKGVLIEASDTVVVYGLNHAPETSDAFLTYPVSALDTVYSTMCWPSLTQDRYSGTEPPSQFAIVAPYDGTKIIIRPSDYTWNFHRDTAIVVTLNRGETYLVKASTFDKYDLTGSTIRASRPIAVFSGHKRAAVPQTRRESTNRDHLVEQMPPISRWDSAAFVTPHPTPSRPFDRNFYRVLAAFDSTVVRINGKERITLAAGQFYQDTIRDAYQVTANLPILVAEFEMTSLPVGDRLGDPFMTICPPTEQFLGSYVFVSMPFDAFSLHYITIISSSDKPASFLLDGQVLPDTLRFSPIGPSPYYYAIMEVAEGNHIIRSTTDTPFGLSIYGYGTVDSYGYLGGMRTDRLLDRFDRTRPFVAAIVKDCSTRSVTFQDTGSIVSGFTGNDIEPTITNGLVSNVDFSTDSSKITLTIECLNRRLPTEITLDAHDRNGNRTSYRETIPAIGISVPTYDKAGQKETILHLTLGDIYCSTFDVVNKGSEQVTLSRASFKENTRFSVVPRSDTVRLAPGQHSTFELCITPGTFIEQRDTLIISDTCGSTIEVPMLVLIEPASAKDDCGNTIAVGAGQVGRGEGVLSIGPNPSTGSVTLQIRSASSSSTLEVIDGRGEVCSRRAIETTPGRLETWDLDTSSLPSGTYRLRCLDHGRIIGSMQTVVIVK